MGADGGGTKTALCVIDREGNLLTQIQAPSSDYLSEGVGLVGRVLTEGVKEVCGRAGIEPADIDYAFFGLPTYARLAATSRHSTRPQKRPWATTATPPVTT